MGITDKNTDAKTLGGNEFAEDVIGNPEVLDVSRYSSSLILLG